jgi:hypothetical protein
MRCRLTKRDESGCLGFYHDLELPALPPVGATIHSVAQDWVMIVTGYWFHADTGVVEVQCDDEASYHGFSEDELIAAHAEIGWRLNEGDSILGEASMYRKAEAEQDHTTPAPERGEP